MTANLTMYQLAKNKKLLFILVAIVIGTVGLILLAISRAAVATVSFEAESGTISSSALRATSADASGGTYLVFKQASTPSPTGGRIVNVKTATELTAALAAAKAGDTIQMADGTYTGSFNSTASGTSAAPITLTGSRNAIVKGSSISSGYTLSIGTKNSSSSVSYWTLRGFTVMNGQKGLMFDNVQRSTIDSLYIHDTGQEALHLRNFSSNNTVRGNTIKNAGMDEQRYGEGIYVGTAESNWDTFSQGKPDASNNNQILNNIISYTGAENMDIKEGTHGGVIQGNSFDGHGMCYDTSADCNFGDSMMDMKGEGWSITSNTFAYMKAVWSSGAQENDAVQVHVISTSPDQLSGSNNTFSKNTVNDVDGYGFNVQSKATGVKVMCDNKVTAADKGFANVTCTP
ncbi:MAG TPA: right-handed parallel beta-helix repeat-containing protein [Candidatus Saccharimonadales bacterium]|jgi:hypothetical protein